MSIKPSVFITVCLLCILTGALGSCFFFFRQYRAKCSEVTDLQRSITELQRRFEEETGKLRSECEELTANILTARGIVDSMGEQLATDSGNIDSTISEIRKLREIIQRLKDWYSNSNNYIHRDRYIDRSDD